jgi:hypothetical protein
VGRLGWGCGGQNLDYLRQDAIQIIQYIVVPEAQNLPSLRLQKRGSPLVVRNPILMLSTIEFNHE